MIRSERFNSFGFHNYKSVYKYISKIFTYYIAFIINGDGVLCLSGNSHFFQFDQQ